MKNIYLLASLVVCVSTNWVSAQVGYVITQNNDTIKTKVTNSFFGQPRYRTSDNKVKDININDIKEYQLTNDSTIYRAKKFSNDNKPEFLELIEKGKICLYGRYIQHGTAGAAEDLYVAKNTDSLMALKIYGIGYTGASRKQRKQMFFDLLSDNEQIANAYKADDSFSDENIRKYIHLYNKAAVAK